MKNVKRQHIETNPKPKRKSWYEFDFTFGYQKSNRFIFLAIYISFWVFLQIANTHYAEQIVRKTEKLRAELKDLKADFYTRNASLSNSSMQSKVAKAVEHLGLKPLVEPPKTIIYDE